MKQALAESQAVSYRIMVVGDTDGGDRTAYLDQLIEKQGRPGQNELLIVIFAKANYDIRFAMGTGFNGKLAVADILAIVRNEYLPEARKGDPSAGIAKLVRAVNAHFQ